MVDRVLLTGISGFLGQHIALQLLDAGYHVKGSVRDLAKADKVRTTLQRAGADISRLEFAALLLTEDQGWTEAMEGCRYLIHSASPVVLAEPKDRQEVIGPAVAGTRRAVLAALAAGAARIVLTSSTAAIQYGHADRKRWLTEADWTDCSSPRVSAYSASKTLAEKEAWGLVEVAGRRDALAVINPAVILGPMLDEHEASSLAVVRMLIDGKAPAVPKLELAMVDVRDVAALHVDALTNPAAGGERCVAAAETVPVVELGRRLSRHFPAYRIPRHTLPDWLVRLAGRFDKSVGSITPELGRPQNVTGTRGGQRLGRALISAETAAVAAAESLVAYAKI